MDTVEENSTSNQLIETSNQYFPQKSLNMQEGINMQPGVPLQIQKNIFQKETKKKKQCLPITETEDLEKVDFHLENTIHNVPSIIESPALPITNKIIKKESKQILEDEVVLIKHIQTLSSSVVLQPFLQTKTATYIYKIIPFEKELVSRYDKARIKAKTFPNDEMSINNFLVLSAQLKLKIVARNEELNQTLRRIEMNEISERNALKPHRTNIEGCKNYDDIICHLKIIRALRSALKF